MTTAPAMQCRVCRKPVAEYTCPRCNARYCSVDCYRQHSERCTEGFYRDAAVSELKSISASEDEKQHMLEILQRMHQQEVEGSGGEEGSEGGEGGSEEEDEEAGGLSGKTLHRLLAKMQAAGGTLEVTPEDLSPEELAAFHRSLAAGELSGAVDAWRPWWLTEDAARLELSAGGTALVMAEAAGEEAAAGAERDGTTQQQQQQQEQQQQQQQQQGQQVQSSGQAAAAGALPAPPSRPLPPLAALTKAPPSPLLQYQLLDLLYAYCLTLRRYNGDYQWEAADAADTLFALSSVLASVAPPSPGTSSTTGGPEMSTAAAAPALLGCVQRACQPPVGSRDARTLAVSVLSDVAAMLQMGRPVVLTALMDTSRLVEAARQQVEAGEAGGGEGGSTREKQQQKQLRRRLVAAERKLLFFLSWANEQAHEAYELLAMTTAAEHQKHSAALGAGSQPTGAAAAAGLESLLVGRPHSGSGAGVPGGSGAEAEAGGDGQAPGSRVLIEELV